MPFIGEAGRAKFEGMQMVPALKIAETPGERCYIFYRHLMMYWHREPRWATAHNLYKEMANELPYLGTEDRAAYNLAWQVFFAVHVMPYELAKREENGEVGEE